MTRSGLLTLAIGGALLVLAVNVRYAVISSDAPLDAAISAGWLGFVTLAALTFPAVALRVWRDAEAWRDRIVAVVVFVVALAAMLVSMSNSLGFMAARNAGSTAAAVLSETTVADARSELEAFRAQRAALPSYVPTTAEAVQAARDAVATAQAQRDAECQRRGPLCRDREADERLALDRLSEAERNRATTSVAEQLDGKIAAAFAAIRTEGPIRNVNPQGEALANLIGLPASWAQTIATWQQAALVILMELVVLVAFLSAETMRKVSTARVPSARTEPPEVAQMIAIEQDTRPEGATRAFAIAMLYPDDETNLLTLGQAQDAYRAWCRATGVRPVPSIKFACEFLKIVQDELGLSIRHEDEAIQISGAKLAEPKLIAAA